MGQLPQLQPQEDFPFFLFLTIFITTAATMHASTRLIIIVAILADIHASINETPFMKNQFILTFAVSLVASL